MYDDNANYFQDEYKNQCPVCELQHRLSLIQDKLKTTNLKLKIFQTCEACQAMHGDCDKNRDTCKKLNDLD